MQSGSLLAEISHDEAKMRGRNFLFFLKNERKEFLRRRGRPLLAGKQSGKLSAT